MTDHVHDPEQCADCRGLADRAFRVGVNSEAIRLAADTAPLYSEADRQAAYKAGWDDARAVIDRHVTTRAEINEALANDPRVAVAKERDQG